MSRPQYPGIDRLVALAVIGVVAGLMLTHIGRGFRTDEMSTFWTIDGNLGQVLDRNQFGATIGVYFVALWSWAQVAGMSEVALRLPSVIAVGAASVLVYRTGRDIAGNNAGWAAAMIFVAAAEVFDVAGNARPFGVMLFLLALSSRWLLRWIDTGRTRDGLVWIVTGIGAVHMHLLAGILGLLPQAGFVLVHIHQRVRPRRKLLPILTVGVISAAPLVPRFFETAERRGMFSVGPRPDSADFLSDLAPPAVAIGLLVVLVFAGRLQNRHVWRRTDALFTIALAVVPVLAAFVVSRRADVSIYLPRYFVAASIGVALVMGLLVGGLRSPVRRAAVLAAVGALSLWAIVPTVGEEADYRETIEWAADAVAGQDATFVFEATHISASVESYFREGEQLDAPFVFQGQTSLGFVNPTPFPYPGGGPSFAVPWTHDQWAIDYVNELIDTELVLHDVVVLIGQPGPIPADYGGLLRERLSAAGYGERVTPSFERELVIFERR